MFRLGYYQFKPAFGQVNRNLSRIIKDLSDLRADLVVLPELALTGYYFSGREEVVHLSEDPKNSRSVDALVDLCKARDFYMVIGFSEKSADKYFNSALLLGPQGLLHTYRKVHLFSEEKNCFDPGDIALQVDSVRGAKVGMMICFDWIFPEVMRSLSVLGADIICHPSNLVLSFCQNTMLSRCLENAVFAVTANRFGSDKRPHGELRFTGKSQIVAPKGVLLKREASQRTGLFISEIDPSLARNKQITPLNHLMNDRRPEFYEALVS